MTEHPVSPVRVELRGRQELLNELSRLPERGPVVLTGPGGVGKSTVARALAARVRDGDRRVWWVPATDSASLSMGLVAVARQLGASTHDVNAIVRGKDDAPDRFWRLLDQVHGEWLLVFDNADDPRVLSLPVSPAGVQDARGWVRPSRRGLVLVTSRENDARMWAAARVHRLGPLAEADAAQVLRDLAPAAGDERQARALARRLDRLPLALHLAGTYLSSDTTRWSTFTAYSAAVGAGAAVPMMTKISLDSLAHHGIPQARTVLRLASCYASTAIPLDLLETGPPDDGPLADALRGLRGVGLLQDGPDGAVNVHPVVTDASRTSLAGPEAAPIHHRAVEMLAGAVRGLRYDQPAHWPTYRQLGQHLLALLDASAAHVDQDHQVMLASTVAETARAFSRSGASKAAKAMCHKALARCAALGADHPGMLAVRHQLAWAVAEQGDLDEAERMYTATLEARERVLAADDPDLVASRHELAWITACQGRWPLAEARYRRALHDTLAVLGPHAAETLTTRHELAWAVANQGRLAEARAVLVEVLADRGRELGEEHQQTIATQHELAWVSAKQRRWEEAAARYRKVLALRERVLEPDHPETLLAAHELAWTMAGMGRTAAAITAYEDVLARRRRALGDDHPDTDKTRQALSELRAGRVIEAHHYV
ncbi:tetratricopeptide repeat protein [Actinophytocola sp.]|uniref:tetratricopeptide repeat protein n=1 Tax=Actinophytocola sp. TaxID=1872138 RepID=UPI003C72555F